MSDDLHLLVETGSKYYPSKVMQIIKCITARKISLDYS